MNNNIMMYVYEVSVKVKWRNTGENFDGENFDGRVEGRMEGGMLFQTISICIWLYKGGKYLN